MKKKILLWILCFLGAVLILVLAAALFMDPLARILAERRIRAETGLETDIGILTVGISSPSIRLENFILKNSAEFGGGTFMELPELFISYDRDALRAGKIHLKVVRIDIAKINVVENKQGKRNIDELQKLPVKARARKSVGSAAGKTGMPFALEGIDTLEVSVRNVQFTNLRDPGQNMDQNLSIRNELFRDLKTDLDYQTAGALLTIKAGISFLFNGDFSKFGQIVKKKSRAEKKSELVPEPAVPKNIEPTTP